MLSLPLHTSSKPLCLCIDQKNKEKRTEEDARLLEPAFEEHFKEDFELYSLLKYLRQRLNLNF